MNKLWESSAILILHIVFTVWSHVHTYITVQNDSLSICFYLCISKQLSMFFFPFIFSLKGLHTSGICVMNGTNGTLLMRAVCFSNLYCHYIYICRQAYAYFTPAFICILGTYKWAFACVPEVNRTQVVHKSSQGLCEKGQKRTESIYSNKS